MSLQSTTSSHSSHRSADFALSRTPTVGHILTCKTPDGRGEWTSPASLPLPGGSAPESEFTATRSPTATSANLYVGGSPATFTFSVIKFPVTLGGYAKPMAMVSFTGSIVMTAGSTGPAGIGWAEFSLPTFANTGIVHGSGGQVDAVDLQGASNPVILGRSCIVHKAGATPADGVRISTRSENYNGSTGIIANFYGTFMLSNYS